MNSETNKKWTLSLNGLKNVAVRTMALAPLALVMGFAVHPTPTNIDFDALTASQSANERIGNYVPYVQAVKKLGETPNAVDVKAVADEWIKGIETGKLLPLYAQTFDDSIQGGVKIQIVEAARALDEQLEAVAKEEAAAGHPDLAAQDFVRSAEIFQSVKYSGNQAVAMISLVQKRSMDLLGQIWTEVPTLTKVELRRKIEALKTDPKEYQGSVRADRRATVLQQMWVKEMTERNVIEECVGVSNGYSAEIGERIAKHGGDQLDKSITKLYPAD